MRTFVLIIIAVISYLLGSLNGSIIVSRRLFHKDIRRYGSGNAGLTNFHRTFGLAGFVLVFLIDFFKAFIAAQIGGALMGIFGYAMVGKLFAGFCAMLGHSYPVFFGFRGGKGVLCYKITEKTGALIGAKLVNDGREIMLITTEGIIIRMSVDDISIIGRNTSGVKLMSIEQNSDIKVASIAKVRESVTKDSNVYDEEHYEEDSESDSEDTADNV